MTEAQEQELDYLFYVLYKHFRSLGETPKKSREEEERSKKVFNIK